MAEPLLTVLNLYTLKAPAQDFVAAITHLSARVAVEGHPGVLSYRFFVSAGDHIARAVIDYARPDVWIGHHEIAMGWPEMTALHRTATLTEVTFLGLVSGEMTDWLARSGLTARIVEGFDFAAGFRRHQDFTGHVGSGRARA